MPLVNTRSASVSDEPCIADLFKRFGCEETAYLGFDLWVGYDGSDLILIDERGQGHHINRLDVKGWETFKAYASKCTYGKAR